MAKFNKPDKPKPETPKNPCLDDTPSAPITPEQAKVYEKMGKDTIPQNPPAGNQPDPDSAVLLSDQLAELKGTLEDLDVFNVNNPSPNCRRAGKYFKHLTDELGAAFPEK